MAAYLGSTAALRARLLAMIAAFYAGQGNYRDAAAAGFVATAVPVVQAAQQTMAALTSAYLSHMVSSAVGGSTAPVGVPAELIQQLRGGIDPAEVYRRPYVQVWTDLSNGKSFDDAVAAGARRAGSLASTDLQLAKTRAAQYVMADDRRVVGYRRVLVGAHSCGMCVIASTVRYHKSNLMPIHPGCVVGSTPVSNIVGSFSDPTFGSNTVKATTRRSYTGKLVTITTVTGKQVTITPNHPVLTDQGWIPADFIREGHNVICRDFSHGAVDSSPNEKQTPSLIEDIWRTSSMSGFVTMPLASEDFHGDGANDKVDIVYTDGNFPAITNFTASQPLRKLSLMMRHRSGVAFSCLSTQAPFFPGSFTPSNSSMRGSGLSRAFLGGHIARADIASFRASPGLDAAMLQRTADSPTFDVINRRQSKLRLSSEVTSGHFNMREFSPSSPSRRFDPAGSEFSGQGLLVYAALGSSLLDRLAGQVQVDRVISVRARDVTACQVFNLHTGEGWYNAGGLIVSNCDCAVAPILGHGDPGRTIDSAILKDSALSDNIGSQGMKFFSHEDVIEVGDLLEPAHRAVEDVFGQRATDGRAIDYRKVIMVREHSEMGPMLTVADHKFTKKQVDTGNLRAKAGTFATQKGRSITNIGE